MNHIQKLQRNLTAAHAALCAKDELIIQFIVHLQTPKFQGFDPEGERKDWIAIGDVTGWLRQIADIHPAFMEEAAPPAGPPQG
jgi:hypothetical protein